MVWLSVKSKLVNIKKGRLLCFSLKCTVKRLRSNTKVSIAYTSIHTVKLWKVWPLLWGLEELFAERLKVLLTIHNVMVFMEWKNRNMGLIIEKYLWTKLCKYMHKLPHGEYPGQDNVFHFIPKFLSFIEIMKISVRLLLKDL